MGVKYAVEEVHEATAIANSGEPEKVDLVSTVKSWMEVSDSDRSTFKDDQEKWYKLRMRVKKEKNYPFPECSNIRMPTLDNKIKKLKANSVNSIIGIRPVVQVIPGPSGSAESAKKIEKFLDHLTMDVMEVYNDMVITIDQSYQDGFFLQKVFWKLKTLDRTHEFNIDDLTLAQVGELYEMELYDACQYLADHFSIDRHKYVWVDNYNAVKTATKKILAGQYKATIYTKDVVYNYPDIALIPAYQCYVPSESGYHPQSTPYLIHEYYIDIEEANDNVISKDWDIDSVNFIQTVVDLNDQIKLAKDNKEGIDSYKKTGKVRVAECFGYINGKRQFITIFPDFSKLVKVGSMPTPSGKIPVVKYFSELREDRWYAHRALADIIEDLVKEIDVQHMQKIDNQTIRNSPTYMYRAGLVNTQTTQFMFGQGIAVQGMQPLSDILAPINNYSQGVELSYDREQQILKAEIDEFTGQVDYTLSQQVNRREPRSAEEVSAQSQVAQLVSSLDNNMFRQSFQEMVNLVWEMWCEYGDDEYEFSYFGSGIQETIKLNKEDIQGKYSIVVRANDNNTNPRVRMAKAREILQAVLNPVALQLGIVTPENIYAAYKLYYQELDVNNAEQYYSEPKPQQPGIPDKTLPKFADLEESEQAQLLPRMGIKPDIVGRINNKQREVRNEKADNLTNIVNSMK